MRVGNWDEFARTGNWDLGTRPPMALGVEAAGLVTAVGDQVSGITAGDRVTTHLAPLRERGAWAEQHVAASEHVAVLPPGVPFEVAAALPIPALTAGQAIGDALQVRAGQTVLVHGAGGVTGGMLVQLAAHRGATVIATASMDGAGRVAASIWPATRAWTPIQTATSSALPSGRRSTLDSPASSFTNEALQRCAPGAKKPVRMWH